MRKPVAMALVMVLLAAAGNVRAQTTPATKASEVKLPAEVNKVIRAGNGDFLLLQMDKLVKIAVFDVKQDKIAGYIPLGGNDTIVTGTADGAILLARDKKVVQRWSLNPLESKLTVALTFTEQIDGMVSGYASSGPVLVMTRDGPRFMDPTTLKPVAVEGSDNTGNWHPHPQYPLAVAASADGSTFAGWEPGLSPSGIRILQLQGGKMITKYAHESAGALLPSADGSMLFTDGGVYSSDLKPLDRNGNANGSPSSTFPTMHPAYYAGVPRDNGMRPRPGAGGGSAEPSLSLYSTSDRTLLVTLENLPGLAPQQNEFGMAMGSYYERVFLYPSLKKILILDPSKQSLHIEPLDIVKALNAKGIDYLFVETLPVTGAKLGGKYEYPIKVLSKAGKVTYKLESGPPGMTVDAQGMLRWTVPANFDEKETSVILTIADGSGQSMFHSFVIHVAKP